MRRPAHMAVAIVGAAALFALVGCTTDPSVTPPSEGEEIGTTPEGPADQPHLQYINAEMIDTSEYASEGAKKVCFANASISNPWRQTGWITMNEQLKVLQEQGVISEMETRDAQDSDDTQIADIDYFIEEGNCDAFIISPNSTAAMTPAVEE